MAHDFMALGASKAVHTSFCCLTALSSYFLVNYLFLQRCMLTVFLQPIKNPLAKESPVL
jgi:hypothetical protein